MTSDAFELGRFTHFNRTIERGIQAVDLVTVFTFNGIGGPIDLTATLRVELNETNDFQGVADTSVCAFNVAENTTISTPFVATLCADQVTIQPLGPLTPAFGATKLAIDVVGFAHVVQGQCVAANLVSGSAFFSAEQAATELCLLARLGAGSVSIDKAVQGGPGASFDFTLAEHDQRTTPPSAQPAQTLTVDATTGSGTTATVPIEAGIYRLDEVDSGLGYLGGAPTCTSNGVDATVTIGAVEYLDVDSGEHLVCSFVNVAVTTTTTTTVTAPSTTIESPPTTVPLNLLPATGNESIWMVIIAMVSLLLGAAVLGTTRRRPRGTR